MLSRRSGACVAMRCARALLRPALPLTAPRRTCSFTTTSAHHDVTAAAATTTTSADADDGAVWTTTPPSAQPDWACVCGFPNYSFREHCFQCHAPRPQPARRTTTNTTTATTTTTAPRHERGAGNGVSASSQQTFARFMAGDWHCTCGEHNFARRVACRACAQPRPATDSAPSPMPPSAALTATPTPAKAQWTCMACYSINRGAGGAGSVCAICNTECDATTASPAMMTAAAVAPVSAAATAVGGGVTEMHSPPRRTLYTPRPNDWTCLHCGFANFASRSVCRQCHTARAPHGNNDNDDDEDRSSVRVAAASAQLGMWTCRCGYMNFATRAACRECGSPQPRG